MCCLGMPSRTKNSVKRGFYVQLVQIYTTSHFMGITYVIFKHLKRPSSHNSAKSLLKLDTDCQNNFMGLPKSKHTDKASAQCTSNQYLDLTFQSFVSNLNTFHNFDQILHHVQAGFCTYRVLYYNSIVCISTIGKGSRLRILFALPAFYYITLRRFFAMFKHSAQLFKLNRLAK